MKNLKYIFIAFFAAYTMSCDDYLDIVPDNVATIDYAFRMRSTAEQYLFTCYSFMPDYGNFNDNYALSGADEFWLASPYHDRTGYRIASGQQNSNNPIASPWETMWEAIRECNIFLENIGNVPDMQSYEKERWAAEVKFLKAYYHFILLQHYGPIPIMEENIPVSAPSEVVNVLRQPVDDVFDFIVSVIDEALVDLPERVLDENQELGRVTMPIALGMKAKILTYAASPLFNGNPDYANFKDKNGTNLFNTEYSEEKWQKAVDATKVAIDKAHELGHQLYYFEPSLLSQKISEESKLQMNLRGSITERWNKEILWQHSGSTTRNLQTWTHPRGLTTAQQGWTAANGSYGSTINMAYLFYSENGVPIDEDVTWEYNERLNLRTATSDDRYRIKPGYTTVGLHFDREPRFYGTLGFDGGIWYGSGKYDDADLYWLEMRSGQFLGKTEAGWHPYAGYFVKKLNNYTNTATNRTTFTSTNYAWPILRLADLYLLYAEGLNEIGQMDEAIEYLDLIRSRSGLPGVVEAWTNYSNNPNKYSSKTGLREIVQQERNIEMLFTGERFWDLRRWKVAPLVLNQVIRGWDTDQGDPQFYYREKSLHRQVFTLKDYFWPIREYDLIVNKNLVQNPGW